MVSSNSGNRDPENSMEDLSPNNEIVMAADTDTDEEDNPYADYEPLPMTENDAAEDDTGNSSDEAAAISEDTLPPVPTIEQEVLKEVWSGLPPKAVDIEMDSNKVDQVKLAMVNFTLPSSSIPEWANNIPEEQWKQQLLSHLQGRQKFDMTKGNK